MSTEPGPDVVAGSTLRTAMLSPCVGGVVRTWTDTGSQLWSVPGSRLSEAMAIGWLARTRREEHRYREVALLDPDRGILVLQSRFPRGGDTAFEATAIELRPASEPADQPGDQPGDTVDADLLSLLARAVLHVVTDDGFLVVEVGGWDPPDEPYCLFLVRDGRATIEAAPAPHDSQIWPRPASGAGATVSAPASQATIAVAPRFIADACSQWGLSPWDLALTFGDKPTG